jgi:hypothetical protein
MSKSSKKPEGRPITDDRGNSTWKWAGDTEVETAHLSALAEGVALAGLPQDVGLDPYNKSSPPPKQDTKRRSLDDMRRLNEQIRLAKRLRTPPQKGDSQPRRGMRLQLGDLELLLDERRSSITLGRAGNNDVVVSRERISRLHARIEMSRDVFVLIDQSANGTFVQTIAGEKSFTRRGSLQLQGEGMIGLGRRPRQGSSYTIHFICEKI